MIHLLLGLKWVNCQGIISIYYRKWPCNRYNIIKMFWVTMIHVPFLAFFDIREWSKSISVHCVSVKQIPLLVQGFENLFFLLLKLWAYMTLFICKCQIKLLKQRLLLLITQTHTHAPQNLQFHIRFLLRYFPWKSLALNEQQKQSTHSYRLYVLIQHVRSWITLWPLFKLKHIALGI